MDVLHPRCAGLDVHKDSVVAAVRLAEPGGVRSEVRRFDTTTPGLLALADWLAECGCTHAVMEATGVILEAGPARAGGRRSHAGAGQRGAWGEPARPQDRRGGRRLAGRP